MTARTATVQIALDGSRLDAAAHADSADVADPVLLSRFSARRDPIAFEAIMQRHGPMVLGVCRRLLQNREDAEDAFQATFLVLAKNAKDVRKPESLADWLYGVAVRIAAKARATEARRRTFGRLIAGLSRRVGVPLDADLRMTLDEAINDLPENQRKVVVMCYLEGRTKSEAARQLDWPEGTVATRLSQARKTLRQRLGGRGELLSAGAFEAMLSQISTREAVPPNVSAAVLDAATEGVGRAGASGAVSLAAVRLAEGASRAMLVGKVSPFVALVLCAVLAGGVSVATRRHVDVVSQDRSSLADQQTAGIGVALYDQGGYVCINTIVAGTPAASSGQLHRNDRILAVAQGSEAPVSVRGMKLADVVRVIRGPQGTTVRLTVVPWGQDDAGARVVSFTRGQLKELARWGDGESLAAGTHAPDSAFVVLAGGDPDRLSNHRGKVVVLEFWATWCGPCRRRIAELNGFRATHPEWKDDVVLLTASVDEIKEDAARRIRAEGWDGIRNLWAEPAAIKAFHVNGVPMVYVLGRDGRVAASGHLLDVPNAVGALLATDR